jgi:hypothetical protein
VPGERLCYVCGVTDEVLFHNARALVVDHDAVTRSVVFNDKLLAFAKQWDSDHGSVRRIALAPKSRPRTASECEEKRRCRPLLCNLGKPSRRTSMSGRGKWPTSAFTT